MSSQPSESPIARYVPHMAVFAGILVVLQGFLAGRGLFVNHDMIEVHGYVGEFTFLIAVFLIVGTWQGRQSGRYGQWELGLSILLLVLVFIQLALGFSGRKNLGAAAWHIPNAILITGTIFALIALTLRRPASAA